MATGIGEALDSAWDGLMQVVTFQGTAHPQLLEVAVIAVVGFIGGHILSEVMLRLLRMTSLDEMGVKSDVQRALRKLNYHGTLSSLFADTVRWGIYILTVFAIFHRFEAEFVTQYSNIGMLWLSNVVLAMFIFIIGALLSERIGGIVVQVFRAGRITGLVDESNAEVPLYLVVGRAVKYLGYLVTMVIVLSFLGVDDVIIHILVAVISLSVMLAFLIAGRHVFTNIAVSIYFQMSHVFRGGEQVTIGEYSGEIMGVRPLYTKIRSHGQIYYVPNTKLISEVIEYNGEGE